MHEVAHIVHAMVIFFDGTVHLGLFIPAIHPKLTDAVRAAVTEKDVTALEPGGHIADAVQHGVGGLFYTVAVMAADDLNERGRRWVHNDGGHMQAISQALQLRVVLLIGALAALLAAVIVILPHPVPLAASLAPEANAGGVDGAVVAGHHILFIGPGDTGHNMKVLVEHRVNKPLRHHPQAPDKAIIENARVKALIPCLD